VNSQSRPRQVSARARQAVSSFNERKGRLPIFRRVAHGGLVQIQETDEHLADNPSADRTEASAATPDVGFAQHVVPQRRFAVAIPFFAAPTSSALRGVSCKCRAIASPEGRPTPSPRSRSRTANE